jgi:hypothetical protein
MLSMPYVNVLSSLMLNRILSHLDSTLIITKQRHILEFDSKVIQGGLHPKQLCTTTTGTNVFGLGGR